jgi:phosphoribosyl 1,2-cyclic phosphodiesterase
MLECNHDPDMLRDGPYPVSLKRRVGGNYGHLSNQQAAELLSDINQSTLKHVLVSHVSEQNNDRTLAMDTVDEALENRAIKTEFLTQNEGCDWLSLKHV